MRVFAGADEIDEPDAPQHIEGLTVRQEVEIPADHGDVAVTSHLREDLYSDLSVPFLSLGAFDRQP